MSSLLMMDTCTEGSVGDARVTIQPRSIATSKPSSSTKKSRVAAGRSDLMFGTALLILTSTMKPTAGLEPATSSLRERCSTN